MLYRKIISTLVVVFSLSSLISLGVWQLKRLEWKNKIIKELIDNKDSLFLPITDNITNSMEYKNVSVRGLLINHKSLLFYAGNGYFLLTPLFMDNGKYLLVDRGWIPLDSGPAFLRKEVFYNQSVVIKGMLRKSTSRPFYIPNYDQKNNELFWLDMKEINNITQLEMPDFYLLAKNTITDLEEEVFPRGRVIDINQIKNDHLSYAITWFSLAIILMIVSILYYKKNRD